MIINDDTTLRRYLPNAFATVDDETSLFDKLEPWLKASEEWLCDNIVGDCLCVLVLVDFRGCLALPLEQEIDSDAS